MLAAGVRGGREDPSEAARGAGCSAWGCFPATAARPEGGCQPDSCVREPNTAQVMSSNSGVLTPGSKPHLTGGSQAGLYRSDSELCS